MMEEEKMIILPAHGPYLPEMRLTEDEYRELQEEMLRMTNDGDDGDFEEPYESIDDIAKGEGFWIDEDGHWRELPDVWDW